MVSDDGVNNWFPTIDGVVVVMLVVRVMLVVWMAGIDTTEPDGPDGPDGNAAAAVGRAAVESKGGEVGLPTAVLINPRIE